MNEYGMDEEQRQAIQRLVAALSLLATICERLRFFPRPVRLIVLWAYRPFEVRVRTFILEMIADFGFWADFSDPVYFCNDSDRADVMRMAARFDLFAITLEDFLDAVDTCGVPRDIWAGGQLPPDGPTARPFGAFSRRADIFTALFAQLPILPLHLSLRRDLPIPDT